MANFDSTDFPPLTGGELSADKESKEPEEAWEILTHSDEDDHQSESIDPQQQPASTTAVLIHGSKNNPKTLRHCSSSPDLRCFAHMLEDEEEGNENRNEEEENSSYAMVSNVGSVVSWSTMATAGAGQRSFRDAFLSSPVRHDEETEKATGTPVGGSTSRPFRKPKIVVSTTPSPTSLMRRCSQSSPNLLGMIRENDDDDDDDEILGDTDAGDYYHRKNKGAQGRTNGRKLRPDEAKRKAYSVQKRNLQRQSSRN